MGLGMRVAQLCGVSHGAGDGKWGQEKEGRTSKMHFVNGQLQGLKEEKPSSACVALLFSRFCIQGLFFFFFKAQVL